MTTAVGAESKLAAVRRARSAIPADEGDRPTWRQALEMTDELATWGQTPPVHVGDAGYGDNTTFRCELAARGLSYVMAVKAATSAQPGDAVPTTAPYSGRGRRRTPRYPDKPSTLRGLVLNAVGYGQPTATSPEATTAVCPGHGL